MATPAPDSLDRALLAYFAQGLLAPTEDAEFNALALAVFAYQYEANPAYHAYCQRRGALPQRLRHWSEIPAVPAQAFKDVRLWCDGDADAAGATPPAAVFRTSGTTLAGRPGEHYMSASGLALYDASLVPTFRGFVLPELAAKPAGARSDLALLALGPPPPEAPHSSLWHMVEVAGRALFTEPARWFLPGSGLAVDALVAALEACVRDGRAACVVTTDIALDACLSALAARGTRFALPAGSRLVHTGGSKGRLTTVDPGALVARAQAATGFGLASAACVSEYGMTELATQFYGNGLRAGDDGFHYGPPWIRATVMDVHTLEPLPPGHPGVLRFHDLANRGSAFVVQSEDFAVAATDAELGDAPPPPGLRPFRLLGRAQGSAARGCSLDAEAVLT